MIYGEIIGLVILGWGLSTVSQVLSHVLAKPWLDKRLLAKTNNNPLGVNGAVKQPQASSKPAAQDATTGPIVVQPSALQPQTGGVTI